MTFAVALRGRKASELDGRMASLELVLSHRRTGLAEVAVALRASSKESRRDSIAGFVWLSYSVLAVLEIKYAEDLLQVKRNERQQDTERC